MSSTQGTQLKRTLGVVGLATLGAVMMSPALGIYGNWGPMAALVGRATPLVFLAALAISLPTAISYALLSRELPSAGSAFAWMWQIVTPRSGAWTGLMMAGYYTVAVLLQPLFFGLFFNDLLSFLGVGGTGILTWAIGATGVTVLVASVTYRGVEVSTRTAVTAVLIELAVVVALCLTIIVTRIGDGGFTLQPFNPSAVHGGLSSFWSAMILGILSFTGFDVVSTVAEEADAPKRILPKATLFACVTVGLFWAFGSWVFSMAEPLSKIDALNASGLTAATPIADDFWGAGRVLVIITGLTAAAGSYVATVVGASRVVFAMGRQGVLPASFGSVHPTYRVPWNAMHAVYAVAIVGGFGIAFLFNSPLEGYVWWAGVVVFFALLTYVAVNLCNAVHFWREPSLKFNWFLNGLIPVVGIGLDGYLIYKSFFKGLLAGTFRDGKSVVLVGVLLAAAAGVYVLTLSRDKLGATIHVEPSPNELTVRSDAESALAKG